MLFGPQVLDLLAQNLDLDTGPRIDCRPLKVLFCQEIAEQHPDHGCQNQRDGDDDGRYKSHSLPFLSPSPRIVSRSGRPGPR